jgi:hypothetical protein
MAEQLKNIYTREKLLSVASIIHHYDSHFDVELFLNNIFDNSWEQRELKERIAPYSVYSSQNYSW